MENSGKKKKNTIETKIRENRAEPYEQENNDEKAKQILEEKCAKSAKNVQRIRKKEQDKQMKKSAQGGQNAQRMREKS